MSSTDRPLPALAYRLAAAAVLATLVMLVKFTHSTGVALGEILFWRSVPTVFFLGGWLAWHGQLGSLRTDRLGAHAVRSVLGVIGMALTFGAPLLMPLAESTALGFTTPLFAVVLSALLLHERIGPVRWVAVGLGFLGVIVLAQAGGRDIPPVAAAVGLGAGFMVALISIQVRDLTRTDQPLSIVFWFATLSSPVLLVAWLLTHTPHDATQWLLLASIGVLGCLVQVLLTSALRYGQVASVIVMDYTALIWATLYGVAVFGEHPTLSTWLGAPLIVAAGAVIAWREHRLARKTAALTAHSI